MIFYINVYVTLFRLLKIPQVTILGDLHCLKGSCFFFWIFVQPHCPQNCPQIVCPNPSPKPFSQSRKIVNLWPGQIPGEGQVQLWQGYKEKPLLAILCSRVSSTGVSTCLHSFDQKELPCQDFLCLLSVCFWHWRVFNSKRDKWYFMIWVYHSLTIHLFSIFMYIFFLCFPFWGFSE
jgi:hypothetical protein